MNDAANTPQDYGHPDYQEVHEKTHTEETEHAAEGAQPDVVSDPALGVHDGSDWSDEGGASPAGPAIAEDI